MDDGQLRSRNHRISIACEPCRKGKRKCDGIKPSCTLCERRGRECSYSTTAPLSRRSYISRLRTEVTRLQSLVKDLEANDKGDTHHDDVHPSDEDAMQLNTASIEQEDIDEDASVKKVHVDGLQTTSSAALDIGDMGWQRGAQGPENPSLFRGPTSVFPFQVTYRPLKSKSKDAEILGQVVFPPHLTDRLLKSRLCRCFNEHINYQQRFVEEESLLSTENFPNEPLNYQFLHSAILSVGAILQREDEAGDIFADFAEHIALQSCRKHGDLIVFQALTILTWRELTVGGNSTRAWMFNCMAAGMVQQLGLHILEMETRTGIQVVQQDFAAKVRAFWSFSAVDRVASALLGRQSSVPWHFVTVPRLRSTLQEDSVTIEDDYFDNLGELWRLHGYYMNSMYAPTFQQWSDSKRELLLQDSRKALHDFYDSIPSRLKFKSPHSKEHPFLYFFHTAYETSPILLSRPLLSNSSAARFRSNLQHMASAASAITDIIVRYRKYYTLADAPVQIIYHIVRAATVHLVLATSEDLTVQRTSSRRLKICLDGLEEMQQSWQYQGRNSISFIRGLAARWQVVRALPLKWSHPLDSDDSLSDSTNERAAPVPAHDDDTTPDVDIIDDAHHDLENIDVSAFELLWPEVDGTWPFQSWVGDLED